MASPVNPNIAQLGAALSDLVAHVYALATENERGPWLQQRLLDVRVSATNIIRRAELLGAEINENEGKTK